MVWLPFSAVRIAVLLIALGLAAGLSQASPAARSGQCGLPDSAPLWIDYAEGSVSFRNEIFGKPGVIAATSGVANSEALRAAGAQTVNWWMKLNRVAGTPTKPTSSATVTAGIEEIFTKAVAASACETPLIVLNELNGSGATTPWTPDNAQYRANVLELLRGLAGRGARPMLLISARPYTSGEALEWWRQAGEVADLVREVYFPAPPVMRKGVVLGSRAMRESFRAGLTPFLAAGIKPERLGLVIGFQSGIGKGGREGLQPTSAWLRFVKLATLSAEQVAKEFRIGSVVSWGWGTFDQAGADADKSKAACTYLWARDEALCDAPTLAGPGFHVSRDEGQIVLPPGARCTVDGKAILTSSMKELAAVTGDKDVALSSLFARLVDSAGRPVSERTVLEIEQSIVDVRFGGSRYAYTRALRAKRATAEIARAIIADQLRRGDIARKLSVSMPTAAEVALYHSLYGALPARHVSTNTAPSWLGGKRRGYALVPPGPAQVLSLETARSTRVVTRDGALSVKALDEILPIGVLPLAVAGDAVRTALVSQARARAFQAWSVKVQGRALSRARCSGDVMPATTTVGLVSYLPFLALDA